MPKYLIRVNAGYGNTYTVDDCENLQSAKDLAGEVWNEEVQSNADYDAAEFTKDHAYNFNLVAEWNAANPDDLIED